MKTSLVCNRLLWCAASAIALATTAYAGDESKAHGADRGHMQVMDQNQDGKISATEHAAGAKKMFERMDADHDGRVTATEMDASHKDMPSARSDKPLKSSADKIKTIDADGDGAITAREHEQGSQKMFGKMDKDGDGTLSTAEVRAGHERMMTAEEQ